MADNRLYLQTQKFTLSASISLSDTTIALSSFNFPDGTAIVSGDLGSLNFATLEPGTSREEQFSFTGLSGTSLTGVTRGLRFDSPYTQDTSLRVAHAAGAILVISNTAAYYDQFINKNNDETYVETLTFTAPNYPKMSSVTNAPVDDEELASKKYVDDTSGGASVSKNREVIAGNAGETVAAGNFVFLDEADSEWKKTDGTTAGTIDGQKLGIAQGAGTDGAAISGGILLSGLDSNQTGLSANNVFFLSDTNGAISTSAGTIERAIGIAISTTQIVFDPYFKDYLTAREKDASTQVTNAIQNYAVDSGAADVYVVTLAPIPSALTDGQFIRFRATNANTGSSTLNVNGLGAKTIKKQHDQNLVSGDIEAIQSVIVQYDSSGDVYQMVSQLASTPITVDIQTFTTSGADTWTKPSGAKSVEVWCFGAGGGGGSGSGDAGNAGGGAGASGGGLAYAKFVASGLASTETLAIGAGGAGGAAVGASDGNIGVAGGNSTFGTTLLVAFGGVAGPKGEVSSDATGATGLSGNGYIKVLGGNGGDGRQGTNTGLQGVDTAADFSPRGGGGGGGNNDADGGAGGAFITTLVVAGGAGGTGGPGNAGAAGTTGSLTKLFGGTGGGGGEGLNASGNAGAGGAGGAFGGGGGGGGSIDTTSGTNSGAGGTGGDGAIVVISYL